MPTGPSGRRGITLLVPVRDRSLDRTNRLPPSIRSLADCSAISIATVCLLSSTLWVAEQSDLVALCEVPFGSGAPCRGSGEVFLDTQPGAHALAIGVTPLPWLRSLPAPVAMNGAHASLATAPGARRFGPRSPVRRWSLRRSPPPGPRSGGCPSRCRWGGSARAASADGG